MTQEQIDAIQVKRDVGSVLEWQHINGLRVIRPENTTSGGGGGLPIDDERLLNLDPEAIGAIAVLQPIDARILYGKRADHGAVLFWSKGRR